MPDRDNRSADRTLLRSVRGMRRGLTQDGPTYLRAEGDFDRVSLPDHEGDVLRDLLLAWGARVVVEIGLAYGASALAIAEALVSRGAEGVAHLIIDGFQDRLHDAGWNAIVAAGLSGVCCLRRERSQFALPQLLADGFVADAAFVDGSHRDRFDKDALSRASLEVHRRFLRRHVPEGAQVLEIGAGPGRFTIELAQIGCRVVVSDVSAVQLALNEGRVSEAGFEAAVVERRLLDIRDLASVPDAAFDAVVAYGGPLSYAFEQADRCLAELLRVARPGGRVVASVMDVIGTLRVFVRAIPIYASNGRLEVLRQVMATGDNRLDGAGAHPCRMFRWREIEAMIARLPCTLVGASASNFLSAGDQQTLARIEEDPVLWDLLLDWEEEYCAEPGALDSGTHLLFALQRQ